MIAVAVYGAVRYLWSKHDERVHQAEYQAKLAEYRSALTPGMTWAQVGGYLRGKGLDSFGFPAYGDDSASAGKPVRYSEES